MTCPFCNDTDFDAWGLKYHFAAGYCQPFNEINLYEDPPVPEKE